MTGIILNGFGQPERPKLPYGNSPGSISPEANSGGTLTKPKFGSGGIAPQGDIFTGTLNFGHALSNASGKLQDKQEIPQEDQQFLDGVLEDRIALRKIYSDPRFDELELSAKKILEKNLAALANVKNRRLPEGGDPSRRIKILTVLTLTGEWNPKDHLPDEDYRDLIGIQVQYNEVRESNQENIRKIKGKLADPERRQRYHDLITRYRMDPNPPAGATAQEKREYHPDNIRVLGGISQNDESGSGDYAGPATTASTEAFVRSLERFPTMDEAINQTTSSLLDDIEPDRGELISPVATPRENPKAWRKADNTDPNLRRIVILTSPSASPWKGLNEIAKRFDEQSADGYADNPQAGKFRVDNIIRIEKPSRDNIKAAFMQASEFVKQERKKVREAAIAEARLAGKSEREQKLAGNEAENALQFEGFMGWGGHGNVEGNEDRLRLPNRQARGREGSAEYYYDVTPDGSTKDPNKKIREKDIKGWEHDYLSAYRYFIHYSMTCHSGALIS